MIIGERLGYKVTTQLLAENGQTIFIGGLMRNPIQKNRAGVPVLGRLVSRTEDASINTETVVLITPRIVDRAMWESFATEEQRVDEVGVKLQQKGEETQRIMAATRRMAALLRRAPEQVPLDTPCGQTL